MSVDAGNTLDLDMDRLLFNLGTINATPYIEIKKEEMQAPNFNDDFSLHRRAFGNQAATGLGGIFSSEEKLKKRKKDIQFQVSNQFLVLFVALCQRTR